MIRILRGDVVWADLNPTKEHEQIGARPVLVLSHDVFNQKSGNVIAMTITSKDPLVSFPLAYELKDPNMPKRSWVLLSHIRILSSLRLGKKITRLSERTLSDVVSGLNEIIH